MMARRNALADGWRLVCLAVCAHSACTPGNYLGYSLAGVNYMAKKSTFNEMPTSYARQCMACPAGKYNAKVDAPHCIACLPGRHTPSFAAHAAGQRPLPQCHALPVSGTVREEEPVVADGSATAGESFSSHPDWRWIASSSASRLDKPLA